MKSLDAWTGYADPGKEKTYLGCGVPLLLADVPWNATETQEKKCGLVIEKSSEGIAEKYLYLRIKPSAHGTANAISYSQTLSYSTISYHFLT